jgi:hypothetical protein
MVDITIVFMGFINQLITGGHHPAYIMENKNAPKHQPVSHGYNMTAG